MFQAELLTQITHDRTSAWQGEAACHRQLRGAWAERPAAGRRSWLAAFALRLGVRRPLVPAR